MQQGMFDTAVADSKAARQAGRALHEKVKATLQASSPSRSPISPPWRPPPMPRSIRPRQAEGDPGRMARALRDVHGRAEGSRRTCCKRAGACRIVPAKDARAHAEHVRSRPADTQKYQHRSRSKGPASRRAFFVH
jgi:hypothetical protein